MHRNTGTLHEASLANCPQLHDHDAIAGLGAISRMRESIDDDARRLIDPSHPWPTRLWTDRTRCISVLA